MHVVRLLGLYYSGLLTHEVDPTGKDYDKHLGKVVAHLALGRSMPVSEVTDGEAPGNPGKLHVPG